jgi:hypothetical protein
VVGGAAVMMLDISREEIEFLLELLESKQSAMLHEIHHTDTNDFKELLKEKVDLLERLKARIERLST